MTLWGIIALSVWAAAVLLANISGLFPASVLSGLHASRLGGGTVNQLRVQVAEIAAENDRMKRENNLLLQRFDMEQEARSEVTRRVGALEISLPHIVERIPESAAIDNSVTASIGGGKPMTFEADGGTVTVEQKPLMAFQPKVEETVEQEAEIQRVVIVPDGSSMGVALGFPIAAEDGEVQWQSMMGKVGTLLIGLEPVLSDVEGSDGKILVAGPFETKAQAAQLCGRLDKVGIPCEPTPFKGEPLPMLN